MHVFQCLSCGELSDECDLHVVEIYDDERLFEYHCPHCASESLEQLDMCPQCGENEVEPGCDWCTPCERRYAEAEALNDQLRDIAMTRVC